MHVKHGLTIGIERINQTFFLSMKAIGTLTHADYEKINPVIDAALQGVDDAQVNVFLDASELEGWELRAAWDDFKLGLKYGGEFKKIAIYGHEKWQKNIAKLAVWFISGDLVYFDNADEALQWLNEEI